MKNLIGRYPLFYGLFVGALALHGTFLPIASAATSEFRRANQLLSEAAYTEALSLYQQAAGLRENKDVLGKIFTRIGDCHFNLGEYSSAQHAYQSALKYQRLPERAQTHYWIGFSALMGGDNNSAAREFLKIPEQHPKSGMWVSTAWYWAGRAYERMGNATRAAECYQKAAGRGKGVQGQFALNKMAEPKD